ncbi:conserved within P. aerophilum [Pyrobaculum aerophilum str. IM2]|uniref:Conserved within P. aerophilum n=2 Tax=Pyrobaculum aerophilum TaxID=13773 RepID=Q8ZXK4_PYRAE|nr:hypothetical protein [Pyrobaculum aerophilum]AAL63343.1 conserved within P. aerophilum [Pyrobaculum aerophilum str. IM2]HII47717.1 hypothetical protein [Pyrobaculum aerophilum]
MEFVEFLKTLEEPLQFFLQYRLRKMGLSIDDISNEEALEAISKAVGSHVAELLYTMYLEAKTNKREWLLVSVY